MYVSLCINTMHVRWCWCVYWLLYTLFPSIPSIRFHSYPASLDKEKTPVPKLPSLSFFSTLPTNALQWGRAVYTCYVYVPEVYCMHNFWSRCKHNDKNRYTKWNKECISNIMHSEKWIVNTTFKFFFPSNENLEFRWNSISIILNYDLYFVNPK